jgi:hypothetical protein
MPNKLIKEKVYEDKNKITTAINSVNSGKKQKSQNAEKAPAAAAKQRAAVNTAQKAVAAPQAVQPANINKPIAADKPAAAPQNAPAVNKTSIAAADKTSTAAAASIPKTAVQKTAETNRAADVSQLQKEIDSLYKTAAESAKARIDSDTEAGIMELRQAEEEAVLNYKDERARIAADEARALDNAALYASARGDNGGVGQLQYSSIMSAAEASRARLAAEQRSLTNETAYEIAALRSKGEYEKADALLEITQERLGRLTELSKWAAEYNLDQEKLDNELEKWRAELDLKRETLASQAAARTETLDAAALFEAMKSSGNPYTYLTSNASRYGIYNSSPTVFGEIMREYKLWLGQ